MADRIHSFLAIAHAQFGDQAYVANGHHVRASEFGEFHQLFFYKVIDLNERPPRFESCDIYVTSPDAAALYRTLMPKASVHDTDAARLHVSYNQTPRRDSAGVTLLAESGPVQRLAYVLAAEDPQYTASEYFTTLDTHFGGASDVEDTEELAVASPTNVSGIVELRDGTTLEASVGALLPIIYLYFGPYQAGVHRAQ